MKSLNSEVAKWFNTNTNVLAMLKGRWIEEREFEDFNDYKTEVEKLLKKLDGATLVKMTKSFTIVFNYNDLQYTLKVKMRCISIVGKPI